MWFTSCRMWSLLTTPCKAYSLQHRRGSEPGQLRVHEEYRSICKHRPSGSSALTPKRRATMCDSCATAQCKLERTQEEQSLRYSCCVLVNPSCRSATRVSASVCFRRDTRRGRPQQFCPSPIGGGADRMLCGEQTAMRWAIEGVASDGNIPATARSWPGAPWHRQQRHMSQFAAFAQAEHIQSEPRTPCAMARLLAGRRSLP